MLEQLNKMNRAEEKTIQLLYADLKQSGSPELVADKLVTKGILSWMNNEDIRSKPTDYAKWGEILSCVVKSQAKNTFQMFVDSIKEADDSFEQLVKKIEQIHDRRKEEFGTMAPGQCAEDLRLQSGDRMRDSDDSDGSTDDDPATPPPVHAVASNQLSLDGQPTLMQCKDLGISSKLASEWYTLAIFLGLEDIVDDIDSDFNRVEKKCEESLKLWIKGKGSVHFKEKITWLSLLRVVRKMYPAFADELREQF